MYHVMRGRGSTGGFNPAHLGSALKLWTESGGGFLWQDTAGTIPAAVNGDTVSRRDDKSGNGNHRTQATAANKPTKQSGPVVRYDGNDSLAGTAVTLAGAFTLYAVGFRAASSTWCPAADTSPAVNNRFLIFSDNNVYTSINGSFPGLRAYTGAAGLILARWRRDAGNNVYFAATGMAEGAVLDVAAGNSVITTEGVEEFSNFTAANNDHRATIIVAADTVANGTDAAIVAYLKSITNVTFP